MDNGDFILKKEKGIHYYIIKSFEETDLVKHMFTTRIGGYSEGPYSSLNLGLNTNDNIGNIMKNYKKVAEILNINIEDIVVSNQIHSTNIKIIDKDDCGKLKNYQLDDVGIDGLITNKKGISLFTFYADCVPLFFLDTNKKIVGLAHSGWKGTLNKIGSKMIDTMKKVYNCNPKDILVGIGPSIGPCCYEVGKEVFEKFNEKFTKPKNVIKPIANGKYKLDLWEANRLILQEKGILDRNISISRLCTSCNNDVFYSYRREKGITGRMAAVIQLI